MAAMLTLLYFTGMTSLREGMYWASGSLNYQPSHMLGLLLAALLLRRPVPRWAIWLAPPLALAMAMANESGMLVEAMALAAGVAWAFQPARPTVLSGRPRWRAARWAWRWISRRPGCGCGR